MVLTTFATENAGTAGGLETVADGETLADGVGVGGAAFGAAVQAASSARTTTSGLRMLRRGRCARRQNDPKRGSLADHRSDSHASPERRDELTDDRQPEARADRPHALRRPP